MFVRDKLRFSNCFLEKELGEIDGDISFWPVEDLGLSSIDWLSITMSELSEVVALDAFFQLSVSLVHLILLILMGFTFSFARHIFFLNASYFFSLSEFFFLR